MNGNGCTMSPNINTLKQSSSLSALHCPTAQRNGETSPEARVIEITQSPTEFSTPDRPSLASVPEGSELNMDSAKDQCKSKYLACSSSTPIKYLHRTPPSRSRSVVVTNPFDVGITERLHLPVCSPSVFAHVVSPNQESTTFRWNIDNLSKIYPADIEEFPSHQYEETLDPETESKAQEAINRFFCKSQQLLPSPWGPRPDANVLRSVVNNIGGTPQLHTPPTSSDQDTDEDLSTSRAKLPGKDVWTQTVLTLPPVLPPSVELALKPFFTFTAEQQQCQNTTNDSISSEGDEGFLSTSTLRRKLFFHTESPSSTGSTPKYSSMSLGFVSSPSCSQSVIVTQGRTFGSPLSGQNLNLLSPAALSPVHVDHSSSPGPANRSNKSVSRLNFSHEDMAVDVSICPPTTQSQQQTGPVVCLSPLGTAPLHDKDTDEEQKEGSQQNKWLRRNKRNSMDMSSDSLRISQNTTPVKSNHILDTSMGNVMDISQSKPISRTNACRGNMTNFNQESTFGYSQSIATSQDTGYVSSCDGTVSQSGATSLFGLSLLRDKMGYEDSSAAWQINPRNVVSSTPTKTGGANYQHN